MIQVTDRAKQQLSGLLTGAEFSEPGVALRLAVDDQGQFSLMADGERVGDDIFESEGKVVLYIGYEIAEPLSEATIDCVDTPEGPALTLSRG
ncbi:MAG: hypothetical protein HYX89_08600 [Chloroflexi bacterium]|nr:hypothetical protein [Chloroflexota bacterium]